MVRLGTGHCKKAYYGRWDNKGRDSQVACNSLCLYEQQCTFASWHPKKECSRYSGATCDLKPDSDYQRRFTTFEKKSSGIL